MRVSKAIREYVESEIYAKYHEASKEIGKEYYDQKQQAQEMVEEIMHEASDKAMQYLKDLGYEISMGYRDNGIFHISGSFHKPIESEINSKRTELISKSREKARKVLFDLEMGDADKKQLKDILDNLTID